MLARIQNAFAAGLNGCKNGLLPRYIVVILDDDLISYLDCKTSDGCAVLFGSWFEWIVKQFKSLVHDRLEQLPTKSKKVKPFFYWLTAPIHNYFSRERNALRIKLNLSMESVIKQENEMRVIKLKDHWDPKDAHLVINDRFTEIGMLAYWKAIDASVKFNITKCEQYFAKKPVLNTQGVSIKSESESQKASDTLAERPRASRKREPEGKDPMLEFFGRRRIYGETRMESREDQLYARSHVNERAYVSHRHRDLYRDRPSSYNNRFFLPRPRHF